MKKTVKILMYQRKKKIRWEDGEKAAVDALDRWPDLKACVEIHYGTSPEIKQYHGYFIKPSKFGLKEGFMKSVDKYCTTKALKFKLIDSITKIIYRIPCSGLRDAAIKENPGLRHFYVSAFWRVFYHRTDDRIEFEEFCPHKKLQYYR